MSFLDHLIFVSSVGIKVLAIAFEKCEYLRVNLHQRKDWGIYQTQKNATRNTFMNKSYSRQINVQKK